MGGGTAPAPRFVGRHYELRLLDLACTDATDGRGSLVVVSGEPGIGKTRFTEEVSDRAEQAGLRVAGARCWVDHGAPPLWPWQSILQNLCGPDSVDLLATDTGLAHVDRDRFARFVAITERLDNVAAQQPVCVVIDDVHAADEGVLLLVRFVARSLHQMPLVLILTRRTGEPDPGTSAARLIDEIESEATPVILRSLDLDESAELLATQGLADVDAEHMITLHAVTAGNPLFLRRIAALGPLDDEALPTALRAAIDQALNQLSPESVHILRIAAVLGAEPTIIETASVAQTETTAVLAAVEEAAAAGLLAWDGTEIVGFTHDLVRSALDAGLDVEERLDAHARAAAIVAQEASAGVDRLARRAYHARAAATRSCDDVAVAVAACQEAAQMMFRKLAYERADDLLSAAVELCGQNCGNVASGRLLLDWAQAALCCGHLAEARQRFGRAAEAAQQENDVVVFAEAALGLGGHWVNEHRAPVERARVLGLQRAALATLPRSETALRCRLTARLAAEAVFDGGPIEPVFEALDAARASRDHLALAEVLSLSHHALFSPLHTRARLPLADELIQVASEAGDGVLALMGLCWRAVDLFHLGDDRALRALEDLRERATALANQNLLYYVTIMDAMLLLRQGALSEAEAAAQRAYELGDAVGEVDTLGYLTAQTVGVRWLQNRDAEVADLAESVAASPTLIRAEFSLRASAAMIMARAGRHRMAKAALDRIASDGDLAGLPQSSTWLVGMVAIVETAAELGNDDYARQAYELLLPYADLPVVASVGVVCTGSTDRSLGIAAATFGDVERAVDHLERAVVANRRLGNRPMTVMAQADLAAALLRRDQPGDRQSAAEMLRQASQAAEEMAMDTRAEIWRQQLAELDSTSSGTDDGVVSSPAKRHGFIYQEDGRWVVGIDQRRVPLPNLVGMRYLATLVAQPGRSIAALTLAGHGAVDQPVAQELLDDQARASYTARARELTTELIEAEDNNDIGQASRLRAELDALVDQLESAAGWGNRPQTFADSAERARTSVRKAIKRAIDAIAAADINIARPLRATIDTGYACCYNPSPDNPIVWQTQPLEPDASDVGISSIRP